MEPQKKCKKCSRRKNISDFYKHKNMADGHLSFCKECVKKRIEERYVRDFEKIREYERKRNQTPKRKLQKLLYKRNHISLYPGKTRARNKLSNAIRDGRIIQEPCVVCGNPKSEGHHPDYRSPLKVIWLCLKHHRQLEKNLINTK